MAAPRNELDRELSRLLDMAVVWKSSRGRNPALFDSKGVVMAESWDEVKALVDLTGKSGPAGMENLEVLRQSIESPQTSQQEITASTPVLQQKQIAKKAEQLTHINATSNNDTIAVSPENEAEITPKQAKASLHSMIKSLRENSGLTISIAAAKAADMGLNYLRTAGNLRHLEQFEIPRDQEMTENIAKLYDASDEQTAALLGLYNVAAVIRPISFGEKQKLRTRERSESGRQT